MKDTYWLVIAYMVGAAIVLWLATLSARMTIERRLRRGDLQKEKKSIWTRDIFDNQLGRAVFSFVIPPLFISWGLIEATIGKAHWRRFDYYGWDAVFIGVGTILIGVALLVSYTFPARDAEGERRRSRLILIANILFIVCFATALFRNI